MSVRNSACSSEQRLGHVKQIGVGERHAHGLGLAALQRRSRSRTRCSRRRPRSSVMQPLYTPRRHIAQSPQPTVHETSTRSPFLTPRTPRARLLDDAEELVPDREALARPIAVAAGHRARGAGPSRRSPCARRARSRRTRPRARGSGVFSYRKSCFAVVDDRVHGASPRGGPSRAHSGRDGRGVPPTGRRSRVVGWGSRRPGGPPQCVAAGSACSLLPWFSRSPVARTPRSTSTRCAAASRAVPRSRPIRTSGTSAHFCVSRTTGRTWTRRSTRRATSPGRCARDRSTRSRARACSRRRAASSATPSSRDFRAC